MHSKGFVISKMDFANTDVIEPKSFCEAIVTCLIPFLLPLDIIIVRIYNKGRKEITVLSN